MPDLVKAVVLGIIQGLTEFLPVSSSGHLAIVHEPLDFRTNQLLFDVFLHVGTLVPVVIVFRRDIASLLTTRRRWLPLLVAGTVPAVIVGALLHDRIEAVAEHVACVGALLIVNGLMLFAGSRLGALHRRQAAGWLHAAAVGVAQAVAILPGISRSGSTISTGLATGLDREDAARFSFLLAIPAILLAMAYELWKAWGGSEAVEAGMWAPIAAGTVVSMIVGYGALRALLAVVRRHRLVYFGWYCIAAGAAVLIYHLAF
jgi:undecaprenyl-diphosphatase